MTEATQFLFWEYINGIFFSLQCTAGAECPRRPSLCTGFQDGRPVRQHGVLSAHSDAAQQPCKVHTFTATFLKVLWPNDGQDGCSHLPAHTCLHLLRPAPPPAPTYSDLLRPAPTCSYLLRPAPTCSDLLRPAPTCSPLLPCCDSTNKLIFNP
jgi:hypothetical protein